METMQEYARRSRRSWLWFAAGIALTLTEVSYVLAYDLTWSVVIFFFLLSEVRYWVGYSQGERTGFLDGIKQAGEDFGQIMLKVIREKGGAQ